jgi:cytochrome c553
MERARPDATSAGSSVNRIRLSFHRQGITLWTSLLLAACSGERSGSDQSSAIDVEAAGYRIYQLSACHRCHGLRLDGTHKAPGLLALPSQYDAERLRRYLANPDSMQAADPRLRELDDRYTVFEMPSYAMLATQARDQLVAFLLAPEVSAAP